MDLSGPSSGFYVIRLWIYLHQWFFSIEYVFLSTLDTVFWTLLGCRNLLYLRQLFFSIEYVFLSTLDTYFLVLWIIYFGQMTLHSTFLRLMLSKLELC